MEEVTLILVAIAAVTALIIGTVVFAVFYSGLLDTVVVGAGKPPVQNLKVAYKFGRGPYKQASEIFTEASIVGPEKCRCLGVYYDDPQQVDQSKLRWAVGCVLAEGMEDPDSLIVERCRKEGFKFFHFPSVTNCVKTSFPYRTALSIFMAIYKVYPELGKYIKENKLCAHPFLEIYCGNVINFMAPLARQDEFYVPEALEEYKSEDEDEGGEPTGDVEQEERGQGDMKRADDNRTVEPTPGPSGEQPRPKKAGKTVKKTVSDKPGEATPPVEAPNVDQDHPCATPPSDSKDGAVGEVNGEETLKNAAEAEKEARASGRAMTEQISSKSVSKRLAGRKEGGQLMPKKAASVSRIVSGGGVKQAPLGFSVKSRGDALDSDTIQEAVVTSTKSGGSDSGLTSDFDSMSESGKSSRTSASRTSASNTTSEASSFSVMTGSTSGTATSVQHSEVSWGSSRLTEFSDSGSDLDPASSFEDLSNMSTETQDPPPEKEAPETDVNTTAEK